MKSLNIKEQLHLAERAFESREYKKSLKICSELIEADPKNSQAFFLMANIFHIKGEIGKAIKAFNKVLAIDPQHTDASISLSVLYNDIGKYDEAKSIFERANRLVKASPETSGVVNDNHINKKFSHKHYELAEMYLTYQRYDEALFDYNKAIALDPENFEARIKLAKCYAKKGLINKAVEELKALKTEQPHYFKAGIALGILLYGNGNILEAQAEWQKVMAKDPGNKEAGMYLNLSATATETRL